MILPSSKPIDLNVNRYTAQYDRLDNYNDVNALQSLKYKSESDREGALDAAAKHFESIFVSMMVKSMRDANKVFSEGNMLQSSQTEFYQQMFDSQLAVSLSTGKGIGLAEVIKRQMSKDTSMPTADIPQQGLPLHGQRRLDSNGVDTTGRKLFSLENYARLPFVSEQKITELEEVAVSIDDLIAKLPENVRSDESQSKNLLNATETPIPVHETSVDQAYSNQTQVNQAMSLPEKFSGPEEFIASLYPFAKEIESKTGIDARLMLAQSALETGWGQHPILKQDGSPSFNLFGIKANTTWQGDAANITTTEFRGGIAMKEQANFRAYNSYAESFNDYAQFLQSNGRYQEALAVSDQPKKFAKELQEAGYATDPKYAEKIGSIVDKYFDDLSSFTSGDTQSGSLNKSIPGAEG